MKQFNIAGMNLSLHNSNNPVKCNFVTRGEKISAMDETQVLLVSRVVLQPRSETFVEASVGGLQESQRRSIVDCTKSVLFDTNDKTVRRSNVHIGRGVMEIDSCTKTIPVKIININTSNAPVTLHAGSVVAVLESVNQSQLLEVSSITGQNDELDVIDKFDNCESVVGIEGVDLSHITDSKQREELQQLLNEFKHVFADSSQPPGRTHIISHSINTGEARPIAQQPYRKSNAEVKREGELINKLLQHC